MTSNQFTLEQALEIQKRHIMEWAVVLKTSVFLALVEHLVEANKGVTEPYKVFRGGDISCWVQNYAISQKK